MLEKIDLLLVLPDKNHNNDRNGLGVGHKQTGKEDQFEIRRSSSIYKRILIVDDQPDIAISLKMVLDSATTTTSRKLSST